jgi:4-amino-4-deoxy-L-arabinose transferase-like glycosyltransferase
MRLNPVRWWVWSLLGLILATSFGLNLWVIVRDQAPDTYDPMHLERDGRLLARGLLGDARSRETFFAAVVGSDYPVAIHYATLPVRLIAGDLPRAGAVGVALISLLAIMAAFGVGCLLFGDRAGLLAAALLAAAPAFYRFSRFEMVDPALAAMTALALLVLFRSDVFASRGWSVLFGLAGALAALTKQSFPLYVALPATFAVFWKLRSDPRPRRHQRLINAAIAFAIMASITAAYYLPGFGALVKSRVAWREFYLATERPGRFVFFPLLVTHGLGWPLSALTAGAMLLLPKRGLAYLSLALWLVPPLFVFGPLFGIVTTRYLLPLLPAAAILAAAGLDRLIVRWRRLGPVIAVLAVAAVLVPAGYDNFRADPRPFTLDSFEERLQLVGIPRPQKLTWNVYPVVSRLAAEAGGKRIVLLFDTPYSELVHEALWRRDPLAEVDNVFENAAHRRIPPELANADALRSYLTRADYLLVKPGFDRDPRLYSQVRNVDPYFAQRVFAAFFAVKDRFELVDQYPYPEDREPVLLYRRK